VKKVADVHKAPFLLTSAKTGLNVETGFQSLAGMIAEKSAK